jgi:hypothetical protein
VVFILFDKISKQKKNSTLPEKKRYLVPFEKQGIVSRL